MLLTFMPIAPLHTPSEIMRGWFLAALALLAFIAFIYEPLSPRVHSPQTQKTARRTTVPTRWQRLKKWGGTVKRKKHKADMGILVTDVATRLRSGASVEDAWGYSLEKYGISYRDNRGVDIYGVPASLRALEVRSMRRGNEAKYIRAVLPSIITLCRLSYTSGAPMAEVLDSCAQGISDTAEATAARDVALAGPRTSAQLLAWMPLFGIVLGAALGVDPLAFLFGSWMGIVLLIFGIIAEILGIMWVRSLVSSAEKSVV